MDYRIIGSSIPVLEVSLPAGGKVFAETGELGWITSSIQLATSTSAGGQSGGFFAAIGRALSGGTLFMTEYTAKAAPGTVAFAAKLPGQILPLDLEGTSYLVHRHGFMCATPGVQFGVGFQQSLGAGVFGGEGFMLQKLSGTGKAFVELYGEVVPYDLAAGETIRCHPGYCGMFQESVKLTVTTVPGLANKLFGGDGLFLLSLTGPGRVWLQSLTLPNLAHAISPYLPKGKG